MLRNCVRIFYCLAVLILNATTTTNDINKSLFLKE